MHKIYSRPRLKFSKIGLNKNKLKKIIICLMVFSIAFLVVNYLINVISPIFDTVCTAQAKSIATKVSNEKINEVIDMYSYEDLFTIEKDNENKISMIKLNSSNVNKITSSIASSIQETFDSRGREDISIALR